MPQTAASYWDIFCTVVDNYGDIGVTWRLARQLANEYQQPVRLWVDDLHSFQRLCPALDPALSEQQIDNVLIGHWNDPFPANWQLGKVVIEAFACELPRSVQQTMQQMEKPPVWLNLEYLTAESWIDDCHGLPSRQHHLTKYFSSPVSVPEVAVYCAKTTCLPSGIAGSSKTISGSNSAVSGICCHRRKMNCLSACSAMKTALCPPCLTAGNRARRRYVV